MYSQCFGSNSHDWQNAIDQGKSGNNGKNDFGWLANCKKVSFHALTPTFNLGIIKRNRRSRSQNVSLSIKPHTELQGSSKLEKAKNDF